MDLTQHLSDDQTALIGCALALLASGGLMWASYFVGQALRRDRDETADAAATVPLDRERRIPETGEPSRRKAA
jgi:hypothetical protein